MSYETDFDSAFAILLGKAAGVITPTNVTPAPVTTSGATTATAGIEYVIDGSGAVITTGIVGGLLVPFSCTITRVILQEFNGTSGSITVDIKRATAGASPSFSSITGSATPHIAGGRYYDDSTLSGWTTALSQGDALQYVTSGVAVIARVTVALYVLRT